MTVEMEEYRDWHRMFGMLLTDLFSDSPFRVEVERDLSQQQQFLDVSIIRRERGRFVGRLPDGMGQLRNHNLVTFKSRHEALDAWAMKELIGAYVAYRKVVSPTLTRLVPEDEFGLYAVCARFPHNLASQVPWQQVRQGVYDCRWGTDTVRVIVAGELPCEPHNAPLLLFSASPELVSFGSGAYKRRSEQTSRLLGLLFEQLQGEGFNMSFTMEDFNRLYIKKLFPRLTPEEQREAIKGLTAEQRREVVRSLPPEERREVVRSLPPEERREVVRSLPPEEVLGALSEEEIRKHLDRLTAGRPEKPRRPRRKN